MTTIAEELEQMEPEKALDKACEIVHGQDLGVDYDGEGNFVLKYIYEFSDDSAVIFDQTGDIVTFGSRELNDKENGCIINLHDRIIELANYAKFKVEHDYNGNYKGYTGSDAIAAYMYDNF